MKKRLLVFDLDGTLLYTLPSILRGLNRTLEPLGRGKITIEECREFVGNGSEKLVLRSLKRLGLENLSSQKKKEILQAYNQAYLSDPIEGTRPYPGIFDFIKERKEAGDLLGVFSNKPDFICQPILRHFFQEGTFDLVRGARPDTPKKPDPRGLFSMMEDLGLEPHSTIYIGDSEVDALLGKAAGARTLLVSYGYRDRPLLEETGLLILDSVSDLGEAIRKMDEEKSGDSAGIQE